MANKTREGREVILMEASLGKPMEKQNWIQLVDDQVPFYCLVKTKENKKCPYDPFKFRFHLNDYMKKIHLMVLFRVKSGPKVTSMIKKSEKKNSIVVNAKEINFKVMTNSLKGAEK